MKNKIDELEQNNYNIKTDLEKQKKLNNENKIKEDELKNLKKKLKIKVKDQV